MGTTLLTELLVVGFVVLGLQGCSPVAANETTDTHRSLARQSTRWTLEAGTLIQATTQVPVSSGRNKAGETLIALVSGDVEDADGQVVIPAGSRVALRIAQLQPATNKTGQDGKITLDVTSLTVRNQEYPVRIRVEPPHVFQGRGVTMGEVEKAGSGMVIGAVPGRIIGEEARSSVIDGAVGAAPGTTAAIRWASRDVVVPPGTAILFVLPQPLIVATRHGARPRW